jgi:cephalosporin hydroxylase
VADSTPEEVTRSFHDLYYRKTRETWGNTFWLGKRVLKCPLDLWIYQELINWMRPDVIVETGTFDGGSALFLASICMLVGLGRVITIDLQRRGEPPRHGLITYVHGSSVDPQVAENVRQSIGEEESVMVILDSDHHRDHVLQELRTWAPLVSPGQFLVVEDTNVNGHPVLPRFGPGPKEAVTAFLEESSEFEVEPACEKFLLTFNPGGFLRRSG